MFIRFPFLFYLIPTTNFDKHVSFCITTSISTVKTIHWQWSDEMCVGCMDSMHHGFVFEGSTSQPQHGNCGHLQRLLSTSWRVVTAKMFFVDWFADMISCWSTSYVYNWGIRKKQFVLHRRILVVPCSRTLRGIHMPHKVLGWLPW